MPEKTIVLRGKVYDLFDELQRLMDKDLNIPTLSDDALITHALIALKAIHTMHPDWTIGDAANVIVATYITRFKDHK